MTAPHSLRVQAERGAVPSGDESGHTDSWGIGWLDKEGRPSLIRQLGSAMESPSFVFTAQTVTQTTPISGEALVLLAHLRKASCGAVQSENAHPILTRKTLLVHNGTLRPPLLETLRNDLFLAGQEREAASDSDTVVLAHWLETQCLAYSSYSEGLLASLRLLLERAAHLPKTKDTYSALNLLIATPDGIFALRQFTDNASYYSLYQKKIAPSPITDTLATEEIAGWVIASEPTDDPANLHEWEMLPPGELRFYSVSGGEPAKIALQ